jgi:hypothetical protein
LSIIRVLARVKHPFHKGGSPPFFPDNMIHELMALKKDRKALAAITHLNPAT